jgi:RHS repeat-associated protein
MVGLRGRAFAAWAKFKGQWAAFVATNAMAFGLATACSGAPSTDQPAGGELSQALTQPPESGCTSGNFKGHEYWFCSQRRSWSSARSKCEAAGLNLVRIDSVPENEFVRGRIGGDSWIGASDISAEGQWTWSFGGSRFWNGDEDGSAVGGLFSNWGLAQPNSSLQDCAQIETDGDWLDDGCNDTERYVCESGTDVCPSDPQKVEPGACGCGVADTDSDHDGVPDCEDRCPNDATKVSPGDCGCANAPKPAGTACDDGLCAANATCNGAGICGNPQSCPRPDSDCQSGFFRNTHYWFCDNDRPFEQARQKCQSVGMDLAVVDDAAEDAFITERTDEDTFIGATDQASEGNFAWLASGQPFWTGGPNGAPAGGAFTNWQSGQPSDGVSGRDCVTKDSLLGHGKWETQSCSTSEAFACERHTSGSGLGAQAPFAELPVDAIVASQPAGKLSGTSNVTPDGSFSYTIPIHVPAGRAGLAPELALQYHSRGGNGLVGVGWSLAGFSEIRRCSKTRASDDLVEGVQFDATDVFCLDGVKLLLHNNVGTYGADGSEYRRERLDYSKIVARGQLAEGGPEWFEVFKKDGQIWEYGRFDAQNGSRANAPRRRRNNLGVEQPVADSATLAWALSRIRDRSGNTIEYHYTAEASAPTTLIPARIVYTNSTGATLYGNGTRQVLFITEARPDAKRGYVNGVRVGTTRRLARIEVEGPTHRGGGTPVGLWYYDLDYHQGPVTGRSRLEQVKWCDSSDVCLAPLKVQWQEEPIAFTVTGGTGTAQNGPGWLKDPRSPETVFARWTSLLVADVTGDGNDDVLYNSTLDPPHGTGAGNVLASDGFGGFQDQGPFTGAGLGAINVWKSSPTDIDNDGSIDLVASGSFPGGNGYQLTKYDPAQRKMLPVGPFHASSFLRKSFLIADFNADGLPDLVEPGPANKWQIRLNIPNTSGQPFFGNPFVPGTPPIPTQLDSGRGEQSAGRVAFTDEDGDGRPELHGLWATAHSSFGLDRNGNPEGFIFDPNAYNQDQVNNRHPLGTASYWRFLDINGDGLKDVVGIRVAPSSAPHLERFEARINTGMGYEEVYTPGNMADVRTSDDDHAGLVADDGIRILDFNGDGMDDILVLDPGFQPQTLFGGALSAHTAPPHVLLSDGRNFTRVDLPSTGALRIFEPSFSQGGGTAFQPTCGWCSSAVGDVDGNGTPDIVQLIREADQWKLQVMRRKQRAGADLAHRIIVGEDQSVSAEVLFGTLVPGWHQLSTDEIWGDPLVSVSLFVNRPFYSRPSSCNPFGSCATRGMNAVKGYRSHEANGHDGFLWYKYTGAQVDTGGRGFLGFEFVTILDERRKSATLLTYDNEHRVGLPIRGYVYPFANRPKNSFTLSMVNPDPNVGPLKFFIQETKYDNEFRRIGTSYVVNVKRQDVGRGFGTGGLLDPFVPEVERSVVSTYDDFGNLTDVTTSTVGGASEHVHTTFDNNSDTWLIGLPRRREVTGNIPAPGGSQQVTRTTAFDYYPSGLVHKIHREPDFEGTPDPFLQYLRTTFNRDEAGLVRSAEHTGDPASFQFVRGDTGARITKVDYDDDGVHPHRIENAGGQVEWLGYHPSFGVPLILVDANGVETRWKYDGFARLRHHAPGGGESIDWEYLSSIFGEMEVKATLAGGARASVHHDAIGREIRRTESTFDGATTLAERIYDELGRVRSETMPRLETQHAHIARYTYDRISRLLRVDNPDGSFKRREYEGLHTVTEWDENDNKSQLVVNDDGWAVQSTNFNTVNGQERAITTKFTHGPFGLVRNVVRRLDNQDVVVEYFHDRFGRTTIIDDPDAGSRSRSYNAFGEIQSETDAEGRVTQLLQDRLGRTYQEVTHDGTTTTTHWDSAANGKGLIGLVEAPEGVVTEYLYDISGRPRAKRVMAGGRTMDLDWTYDQFGRVKDLTYPQQGSLPRLMINHEYGAFGHLDKVVDPRNPNTPIWDVVARDSFGNVTIASFGAQTTAQRVFNPATGRLDSMTVRHLGVDLRNVTYQYRANGTLQHVDDAVRGSREVLVHDALDRLTGWRQEALPGRQVPAFEYTFGYDDLGNPTTTTDSTGAIVTRVYARTGFAGPQAVTSFGDLSFTYDRNKRMTERSRNGQTELRFHYNSFDLPSQIESLADPDLTTTFKYDGNHQRVIKASAVARTFYFDQLFELHQDLSGSGTPPETAIFHIHAEGEEVARIVRKPSGESLQFVHSDRMGSVSAVSTDGAVISTPDDVQLFRFDPFGQVVNDSGSPTTDIGESPLTRGFTGHEHDTEFGLINMRGRMYDPKLHRFLTPDPFVQAPTYGQSHNPYTYAFNSPLRYVDPTGMQNEPVPAGLENDGGWTQNEKGEWVCVGTGNSCEGGPPSDGEQGEEVDFLFVYESGNTSDFGFDPDGFELGGVDLGEDPAFIGERWNPYDTVAPGTSLFGSQFEQRSESERQIAAAVVGLTAVGDLITLADPRADTFDKTVAAGSLILTVATAGLGTIIVKGVVKGGKGALHLVRAGGDVCFGEGTPVHTVDGLKPIEEIEVGDLVWALDEATGERSLRAVTRTFVTPGQEVIEVSFVGQRGEEETLQVTADHPFWSTTEGWIGAQELTQGEAIELRSEGWSKLVSSASVARKATVYNIEVADLHTYFVGEQGLLVHNLCLNGARSIATTSKISFTRLGHAARGAAPRAGFASEREARDALRAFADEVRKGNFNAVINDAKRGRENAIIIPGFRNNTAVAFRQLSGGRLEVRSVLNLGPDGLPVSHTPYARFSFGEGSFSALP